MGSILKPGKVKLIAGLLSSDSVAMAGAIDLLRRSYGETDLLTDELEFNHSDYYRDEMGERLKRRFLSFKRPVKLEGIYRIKRSTNAMEKKLAVNGRRAVNIDPGYVDMAKLVLFSTKDYTHRIHVGGGIYAEITLYYMNRTFNAWPWTYPDYRTGSYIETFNRIRELYRKGRPQC